VRVHAGGRDPELRRDLLGRAAGRHRAQDLALSVAQGIVRHGPPLEHAAGEDESGDDPEDEGRGALHLCR
jgi:hypothetical protein